MLDKLKQLDNRYSELGQRMENGEIYADPTAYTKCAREMKELEPIVTAYREYVKCEKAMHDAEDRSAAMYISNVGEMDDMIAEGNATQLILAHEALMEKRVGDIADAENAAESARKLSVHAGRNSHAVRLYTAFRMCQYLL